MAFTREELIDQNLLHHLSRRRLLDLLHDAQQRWPLVADQTIFEIFAELVYRQLGSQVFAQHDCRGDTLSELFIIDTDYHNFGNVLKAKDLSFDVQRRNLVSAGFEDVDRSSTFDEVEST